MITKLLFRNLALFLVVYTVISLTEYEFNINKWSNFGVISFVSIFCVWSIGITFKTMLLDDERE